MSRASGSNDVSAQDVDGLSHRRARRRPGENRERLIQAGILSFATDGYHGTSTTAIAALAGVPQPHVYANFRTKQELFLACAGAIIAEIAAAPATALAPALTNNDLPAAAPDPDEPHPGSLRAAFLLQWIAVSADQRLQPELGVLLAQLEELIGSDGILSLVTSHTSAVLDGRSDSGTTSAS